MSDEAGERSLFEDIFPFIGKPEKQSEKNSPPDISSIDRAARLIGTALSLAGNMIEDGVTTSFLAEDISIYLRGNGADFGLVIRISVEDTAWHGIPGNRKLHTGEIITIDVACSVRGWWADSARSFAVGKIDQKRQKLLCAAWEATVCATDFITEGYDGQGVQKALNEICRKYGVAIVDEGAGHGIGSRMHEIPSLTYDGRLHKPLLAGHVYTAEPILSAGSGIVLISSDGEAVSEDNEPTAHFEVTVLALPHGNQVLGAPEWFFKTPC